MLLLSVLIEFCWLLCIFTWICIFSVIAKVPLPNFRYTCVKLHIPRHSFDRGNCILNFCMLPYGEGHPGLKGEFGIWAFRGEAYTPVGGLNCLLSSGSRVAYLTIFETSGMNIFNFLCSRFPFTFFFSHPPESLSCCAFGKHCQAVLPSFRLWPPDATGSRWKKNIIIYK